MSYETCRMHPDSRLYGAGNGDIRCGACGGVLGQWNLPWRPRWMIYADDALGWGIARLLPRAAVKWAVRRAAAHATSGRWNAKDAIALTAMQVSRRWRIAT